MGHVKRDIHKKERSHDVEYAYSSDAGIEKLLSDIYKIYEDEVWRGDVAATIIRLDLERALGSRALTPRQRQVVALYYFCGLTQEETASILGIAREAVIARLQGAVASISEHIDGFNIDVNQYMGRGKIDTTPILERWLIDVVAANKPNWWRVHDVTFREIREITAVQDVDYEEEPSEYTWRTDDSMEYAQRKEAPRPVIYPTWNVVGRMRGKDGNSVRIVNNL